MIVVTGETLCVHDVKGQYCAAAAPDSTSSDLQEIIPSIVLRSGMDMAESPIVSAVANKRAEIAGIAGDPMIFWPDVAAEPPAIDLNDPAQTGCRVPHRRADLPSAET